MTESLIPIVWRGVPWSEDRRTEAPAFLRAWQADGGRLVASFGTYPDDHYAVVDRARERWAIGAAHPEVSSAAIDPRVVAYVRGTAEFSNEVVLFDGAEQAPPRLLRGGGESGVSKVALSGDAALLAVLDVDAVRVWELASPAEPRVLTAGGSRLESSIAFDGPIARVVGFANPLRRERLGFWDSRGNAVTSLQCIEMLEHPIQWALAGDGKTLVVAGLHASRPTLCIVDLPAATLRGSVALAEVPNAQPLDLYVHHLALSADGGRVAVTLGPANGPGSIIVRDTRSDVVIARHDQRPHEWLEASRIHIAPRGDVLVWERGRRAAEWRIATL